MIKTRALVGRPLTWQELDTNFNELDDRTRAQLRGNTTVKLFPDGSVRPDTDPGNNTILLGNGARDGALLSWRLPADTRADQELVITCRMTLHDFISAHSGLSGGVGPNVREGHGGFMLRSVIEDIPLGAYKGNGAIFGRVWIAANHLGGDTPAYVSGTYSCFQQETWGNGIVPYPAFEYLRTNSNSKTIVDELEYRVMISSKRFAGEIFSRYSLRAVNAGSQFDVLIDTGDVQDNNWAMDRMSETLSLFDASDPNDQASAYSIEINNLCAHQYAATEIVQDMRGMPWVRP